MKALLVAAVLALALPVSSPSPAHADTLAQQVADELRKAPVYIDASIQGADNDKARLLGRLVINDQILVVILPASATANLSGFAESLTALVQMPRTIAIAVGSTSIATIANGSDWPPETVTSDLMRRSTNVSVDITDRMATFIGAVHTWQKDHPKPTAPSQTDLGSKGGTWLYLLLGVAAASGGLFVLKRRNLRNEELYGAPRRYRRALRAILKYRDKLDSDSSAARDLTAICKGAVKYFRGNSRDDAALLHTYLTKVAEAAEDYYGISLDPGAYTGGRDLMEEHETAIGEFKDFVDDVVRKGNVVRANESALNLAILRDARNNL